MKIDIFRYIDRVIGSVLIALLTPWGRLFHTKNREPKKILVIRLWGMGDAVVSLPIVKTLKERYPKAKLDVLCRYRTQAPYENQKFVDQIQLFESIYLIGLLFNLRHYDVVVDLEQYLNLSSLISWWMGKQRIGFDHGIRRLCYTDTAKYDPQKHMLKNYNSLIKKLGAEYKGNKLIQLNVSKEDKQYVEGYMKSLKISDELKIGICCTVAESGKTRLWENKKWALLCDQLVKKYHAKIIFIGGKAGRPTHQAIMKLMKQDAVDAYETSVRQAFELVLKLDIMISLDTGPMHIAAAQQIPTIGIFGPNTPLVWMPFGPKNKAVYKKVPCSPCILNHKGQMPECLRTKDKHLCMKLIEPIDVMKTVHSILG